MGCTPKRLTVVALLTGDHVRLAAAAKQFLFDLGYYAAREGFTSRQIECLLVADGPAWGAVSAEANVERSRVLALPTETHHPGAMLNHALDAVTTPWLCVFGITTEVSTWVANLDKWDTPLDTCTTAMMAGYRSAVEGRRVQNRPGESHRVHQDDGFSSDYPHAWLQMLDLVPMSNAMVSIDALRKMGGATTAPSLQRMWWWELCLRASRVAPIRSLPIDPAPGVDWHQYPFAEEHAATIDANLHALMRIEAEAGRVQPAREEECAPVPGAASPVADALMGLSDPLWRTLTPELRQRVLTDVAKVVAKKGRALRIAVLGGVNEPAHNQLCFFNYFALMRDWGVASWRAWLDERATIEELSGYDLVVFSRVRSDHGLELMRECKSRGIATLYMIDDNWFWLGREWQEYARVFAPGAAPYDNFLACVQLADVTLTYSQPLAEDLAPHAKRVALLPTNVDTRAFAPQPGVMTKAKTRTRIGYVGSLRKNMLAFDALVQVAQQRDDVDVFVMSNALPPEFAALPADRVHFEPYQFNYAAYAATVMRVAPDVLVAPVGRTRFEASKCPNKYLEISACGAAGVYSRAEPYLGFITENERGLFAGDDVGEWVAAINRLIDDAALRRRIQGNAFQHVKTAFDTRAVLPQWLDMMLDAVLPR